MLPIIQNNASIRYVSKPTASNPRKRIEVRLQPTNVALEDVFVEPSGSWSRYIYDVRTKAQGNREPNYFGQHGVIFGGTHR